MVLSRVFTAAFLVLVFQDALYDLDDLGSADESKEDKIYLNLIEVEQMVALSDGGQYDVHDLVSWHREEKQINLRFAEKCGYYGLKNGQVLTIQSANFNKLTASFEQCTWQVLGHRCTLKTSCPCFDVPYVGDCSSDYLKISDTSSFSHTFCGDTQPAGVYNSSSNLLTLSYRSDGRDVANGFVCHVSCTGKGQRDPIALRSSVSCRV